jgi:uncharacterized protein
MLFTPLRLFIILVVAIATTGWQQWSFPVMLFAQLSQSSQRELAASARFRLDDNCSFVTHLTQAALSRAGLVVRYDASYKKIVFPNGDVPAGTGCSADEIIRTYRDVGIDLQELVYNDMLRSFGAYPGNKEKRQPDTNIDHRIVTNLQVFFKRCGVTLPTSNDGADYAPGDIITCNLPSGQPHIAMVVPAPGSGRPWIVHNMGYGPRLEDRLFDFALTGHYRYLPRP